MNLVGILFSKDPFFYWIRIRNNYQKSKGLSKFQINVDLINLNLQGSSDLYSKIFATMEKHKEVFFTIRLHSAQSAASLNSITDPDPQMSVSNQNSFSVQRTHWLIDLFF